MKSRRRTRRMLSRLWLTQIATAVIIPSVVAALGYRDWADIPAMILMLVGAGTIAILPYWFMAGRAILNKDEGWAVSDSPASAGRGEAVTPADPAAAAAPASEVSRTNPR